MAQNDILTNSENEASAGNQSDLVKRITAERLGRRLITYREHDKVHSTHYNSNINAIVEEQQKQTSQLQLKSIETKSKKTNKKSEKRDHNLSLQAGHSKNARTLETDPEMENAGKKQKLNDGSAVKSTSNEGDIKEYTINQQITNLNSPIPSPGLTSNSANVPPDLDNSLSDIGIPDSMGIKTEEGDFSSLSLNELSVMGDISYTIRTYLAPSTENEVVNCDNNDLNDKSIFNNIADNISYTNSHICSQPLVSTSLPSQILSSSNGKNFPPKNIPINIYKKIIPSMNSVSKSDNIPASQTLMHMAEVHQTKISPTSCGRNMDYNLGGYYASAGIPEQNHIMPNYNHISTGMPMNEFNPNRRQQIQAVSPTLLPQVSRTSPNIVNVKNVSNQAAPQGHLNLKQVQNINANCSMSQASQHTIPKKQSISPVIQPQATLNENHKSQLAQSQNGTIQANRMQTESNPRLGQPQTGAMGGHPNPKTQMNSHCHPDQVNKMPQYQNSVGNMNASFSHTGPSVPSSSPFSTTFGNGNSNLCAAYPCQTRIPLQNHSQAVSHPGNLYMQGSMVNNSGIIRGQTTAVLRGPPPDYRQAAMIHTGSPATPQDVNQMQFHPAAYRQSHQQPANQSLPPNKVMNPNMAGYRAGALQRNRPTGGSMNTMPMIQGQQNSNWMLAGNGMPNSVHVYQDMNNMQRNPQMPMRTAQNVPNINTNQMNVQQCVQMMRGMRPEVPNNRHPMQMTAPGVGHMPTAATNAMNKQCQMQNLHQNHNAIRSMEAYSVGVNNNVHMVGNQMPISNMSSISHGAMPKAQMQQINHRQSPIGILMNQTRLPSQMMHANPEIMQNVGPQLMNYQQNMSGHNSPLQVPNHINSLPSNNTIGHHMPNNVIMHNSNPIPQSTLISQMPDIKSEPNGQLSQPSTPNTDFDPALYNDGGFSSLLK